MIIGTNTWKQLAAYGPPTQPNPCRNGKDFHPLLYKNYERAHVVVYGSLNIDEQIPRPLTQEP